MFNRKSAPRTTIDSLIGATTRLEGDVVFQGGLRIDGHVRGSVVAAEGTVGLLVIGEHGRVDGNVVVGHLVVDGTIQGSVTVSGLVELQSKARISGEVRYRTVEMHRGAVIEGILSHVDGDLVRPDFKRALPKEAAVLPRALVSSFDTPLRGTQDSSFDKPVRGTQDTRAS